jgi:hypothetical protein
MPSQDATFGKIMKDTGQFTDECLVTTNCVLRQRLKGEDALGNIINVNARNNMDSLGEGVGSFTNAELEAVRLYLLKVRDLVIANPSPAFSFPSTLTTGNNSIASTVAIQNWRGTSVSYAFTLVGTNPGDYSITAGASGSCAATSSLAAPNNCNANVTVRFSPTAGGSRPATLRMTFTVPGADPIPFTRDFSLTGTGVVPAPIYQGSTSSLNFSARLGSSVNNSMTITNSAGASANLVLSAFNYSAPQYTRSVSSTCTIGISLAPGASCTLTTTFTPGAAGAQNGSLSIVHNAAGSPDAVTLTGTGTQSLISPTSSSLAFGNVQQGVPKPLNLVVSNTGTATLNFTVSPSSPAAKTGAAAADYAVTGTCILGTPLAALGGTCTLTVTLTPSAQGARPATLTISSDATNGPLVIALSGTGVALPEPVVTPPASDFPDTVISQTSAQTRTVTIQNDRVRTITYAVSDTTDFKIGTESCPTRLVPGSGGVCTIAIQFMPTLGAGEGRRTAALAFTFTGEAPDPNPDPVNVNVAGNALLPLAQSATSLNAAAVVGSPTTTSMLLTNRSASPITLTSLLFSGTAATDYSLAVGNTCTPALVLAPSSSCTLVVGFNPPAAGTRNATLTITHSAAGSPQTVAFLGTATPAPQGRIELSSSTVAYADTQLASTSAQTITVHNGGNLALNFSAFTFGGTNPADFQRSGTCAVGTPLPIAADCTVILTFARACSACVPPPLDRLRREQRHRRGHAQRHRRADPGAAGQPDADDTRLRHADDRRPLSGAAHPSRQQRHRRPHHRLDHRHRHGLRDRRLHLRRPARPRGRLRHRHRLRAGRGPGLHRRADGGEQCRRLAARHGAAWHRQRRLDPGSGVLTGGDDPRLRLDLGRLGLGGADGDRSQPGPGRRDPDPAQCDRTRRLLVLGRRRHLRDRHADVRGRHLHDHHPVRAGLLGHQDGPGADRFDRQLPPVLTLTGVGLAGPNPSLALSTAALAFDTTRVGSQSLPSTVRISAAARASSR